MRFLMVILFLLVFPVWLNAANIESGVKALNDAKKLTPLKVKPKLVQVPSQESETTKDVGPGSSLGIFIGEGKGSYFDQFLNRSGAKLFSTGIVVDEVSKSPINNSKHAFKSITVSLAQQSQEKCKEKCLNSDNCGHFGFFNQNLRFDIREFGNQFIVHGYAESFCVTLPE